MMNSVRTKNSQLRLKRVVDLLLCLVLSPVVGPVLLLTSLLIKLDGGPVFFIAHRAGRNKKSFPVYKFRSMIVNADQFLDEAGRPTKDRITKVGKFIRRFSIDELAQIINIAKGDMSFIGPRPILQADADSIDPKFEKRFLVAPGISGLAQVNGRNKLPWHERFALDVRYVEDYSLLMDFKIFVKTFSVVLTGDGMVLDRNPDQARRGA